MAPNATQPESNPVLQARSRLGVATRTGTPDEIEQARRDLAAAKAETYVAQILATAPPLSDEQRSRIAALLSPRGGERV